MSEVSRSPKFKEWVKGILHDEFLKGVCITFTKTDGTEREMRCTLAPTLIPEDKTPKETGRKTSDEVQRVFDLEKGEWRSFKWDSVKTVTFTIGE